MNCDSCGNTIPDGASFCGQCGHKTDVRPPPRSHATSLFSHRSDVGRTRVMPAALQKLPKVQKRFATDIVVVFDCTASMGPHIQALKKTVSGFSQDLEDNNIDCRLGLVEYRDLKIGEETLVHGFANSPETFRSWVGRLTDSGGGDEPESAIDALYSAMGMDFRSEATRIIVLITDASAHDPGENGKTMNDVIASVKAQKIIVYVIGPDLPGYRSLSDCMGGILFSISRDPDEFRRIVKSLGASISATVPRMTDLRGAADRAFSKTRIW